MKCTELENLALDYLDGQLSRADRSTVEAHLGACAPCAARLHEFSSGFAGLDAALSSWPSVAASPDFEAQVMQVVRSELPGVQSTWRNLLAALAAPFLRPALGSAVAAIAFAAFALVRFYPGDAVLQPEQMTTEASEDIALYQDLPVLEELDMLSNFEVLQEMKGPTP